MRLTKKEIQQERDRMFFKEVYRRICTNRLLNNEQVERYLLINESTSLNEKIDLRVEALEEYQAELQEKRYEEVISDLLAKKENEQEVEELISKEYATLELLREQSNELYEKSEPQVDQVKEAEDGHTKMPIQMLEMLERDERGIGYE